MSLVPDHVPDLHAVPPETVHVRISERIRTHTSDKSDRAAQPGRGHRLIRALTSLCQEKRAAQQRLPRVGKSRRLHHHIRVDTSHHEDMRLLRCLRTRHVPFSYLRPLTTFRFPTSIRITTISATTTACRINRSASMVLPFFRTIALNPSPQASR